MTLKDKEYDFIKRVIALPGEHLEIKNHKVYINGKYLEDEGSTMGEEDCVIPDDSIYVMLWEITGIILWIQENLEQ